MDHPRGYTRLTSDCLGGYLFLPFFCKTLKQGIDDLPALGYSVAFSSHAVSFPVFRGVVGTHQLFVWLPNLLQPKTNDVKFFYSGFFYKLWVGYQLNINPIVNIIKLSGFFAGKLIGIAIEIEIEIEKNIIPIGSIPIPIAISIPIKTT
jgi:hypothetical protein